MNTPKLLVYTDEFLTPSMTFIARQIKTLQTSFEVSVLTRVRRNLELFPFDPVTEIPLTPLERLRNKCLRIVDGREWNLSSGARNRFLRAIDNLKPDIIHAHFGPSGLSILPLAQIRHIPLVVTFHGFDASSFLNMERYRTDLKHLFAVAEIVTVSDDMRHRLIELGADPKRTHRHYIGVPLENYQFSQREPLRERHSRSNLLRFLQVANFVEKKGHDITIRAFARFNEAVPHSQLVLAGEGSLRPDIEALATDLRVRNSVHFVGHQDSTSVAEMMRDSDCFLHHSVTAKSGDKEGIPTVLMEAMASGLPVISTRHAGIPELITEGVDGVLVNERDIGAYTDAMFDILSDRGGMGREARLKIERTFDIDACSRQLAELMSSICRSRSPSRVQIA